MAAPSRLIERVEHYFATYKMIPGRTSQVSTVGTYGRSRALPVIQAAMDDYDQAFGAGA